MVKRKKSNIDIKELLNNEAYIPFVEVWELYARQLEITYRSDNTISTYYRTIIRFMSWYAKEYNVNVPVNEINMYKLKYEHAERYFEYLALVKKLKGASINYALKILSNFWIFYAQKCFGVNIFKNVHKVKEIHEKQFTPTPQQLADYLSGLDLRYFNELRQFIIIKFMANTGVRLSELVALNVEDINIKDKSIHIKNSKNGKYREVPINKELDGVLNIWMKELSKVSKCNALFVTDDGTRISNRTVSHYFRQLANDTNIPITAHSLRRYFATQLIKKGVPVNVISNLLGHSGLDVIMHYLDSNEDDKMEAVKKLDK